MTELRPRRWALGVEYDGHCFHGWQTQGPAPHALGDGLAGRVLPTIQDALENALSQIADRPIQVMCAGRTDAGDTLQLGDDLVVPPGKSFTLIRPPTDQTRPGCVG